ncbi:MAG: hypothetical protein V4717_24460 [Bacteroidota bacterium]
MAYTLSLLTTAADCDAVLKFANKEKKDLDYRILQLGRSLENYSENNTESDAELLALNAEITGLTSVLATLPLGESWTDNDMKLKKAQYSLYLLNAHMNKNGKPAQLERELELEYANQKLASVTSFLADVTTRKAAL